MPTPQSILNGYLLLVSYKIVAAQCIHAFYSTLGWQNDVNLQGRRLDSCALCSHERLCSSRNCIDIQNCFQTPREQMDLDLAGCIWITLYLRMSKTWMHTSDKLASCFLLFLFCFLFVATSQSKYISKSHSIEFNISSMAVEFYTSFELSFECNFYPGRRITKKTHCLFFASRSSGKYCAPSEKFDFNLVATMEVFIKKPWLNDRPALKENWFVRANEPDNIDITHKN